MKTKLISIAVAMAAMLSAAGCADTYNTGYGQPGYGRPDYRASGGQPNDERANHWRQRYERTYSYNDDVYYQQCRNGPDPAGVIAGGLIGGLIGNAASHGGGGGTIAGVIIGGVVGAALTSNLDCEDRSYAYKSYYDGFNSERPGSQYDWSNPHNNHRGHLRVDSYDNDPDGFRCSNFTQDVYIDNRQQESHGRACRQPDGSWATVR